MLDRWSTVTLVMAGSLGILLLMLHSVANALSRQLFNYPLPGTTEYGGTWYLPIVAFFGFVIAQREDKHIEVRLLFDRIPAASRRHLAIFGYLITLAVLTMMAWSMLDEAFHNFEVGLTKGVTGVIMWPVTFLPPVCFAILMAQNLIELARVVVGSQAYMSHAEGQPGENDPMMEADTPELMDTEQL